MGGSLFNFIFKSELFRQSGLYRRIVSEDYPDPRCSIRANGLFQHSSCDLHRAMFIQNRRTFINSALSVAALKWWPLKVRWQVLRVQ